MAENKINALMRLVLKDAEKRQDDAGYGGRMDDGGASGLRDQVHFYQMGMKGETPTEWEEYEVQLDPEYNEYLRLKNKFGK